MTGSNSNLPCIESARREIDAGRLWRAKEILRGNLATVGYNRELYVEYGQLLHRMGELPEAGKYLFLSGVRDEAFLSGIELFLRRHGSHWQNLLGTFPNGARLLRRDDYPEVVATYLENLGAPLVLRPAEYKPGQFSMPPEADKRFIENIGCIVLFIAASAAIVFVGAGIANVLGILRYVPWWVWLIIAALPSLAFALYWEKGR